METNFIEPEKFPQKGSTIPVDIEIHDENDAMADGRLQEELLSTMALIQLPRFAALGGELLWQNSVKLLGAHCGGGCYSYC